MTQSEPRRLILLRHGQTSWNAVQRGQGHADIELDETGHGQAAAVAPYVAAHRPTLLWSSDLARCRQTTEYVAKESGLDPTYDERLREYDLGQRTGLTIAEFAERFPEEYATFATGGWEAVPGGETVALGRARMLPALTDAVAALEPGETGVVVGHGGTLKAGLVGLLGWPVEQGAQLRGLDNCGWVVLEERPPGGALRMTSYNLTAAGRADTPISHPSR